MEIRALKMKLVEEYMLFLKMFAVYPFKQFIINCIAAADVKVLKL